MEGGVPKRSKKHYLLLQMYCNRRYGITVAIVFTTSADREKSDGIVYTWKDYGDKVFEIILTRYPSASMIIAVNDYYENDVINVKDGQCQKCSAAYVGGQTKNVFAAKERHFLGIKEFNSFFQNPLNKIRLLAFLKSHFTLKCKQLDIRFLYYERNKCQNIFSSLLKSLVEKFRNQMLLSLRSRYSHVVLVFQDQGKW